MVETRKGILSKAKLALRPMTILTSLTRRQGSSMNVPLRGAALDPAPARGARGLSGLHEKVLDNADDLIHRTYSLWSTNRGQKTRTHQGVGLRRNKIWPGSV